MKAELGIIGCPRLLEQIIMFIISQYCSLRPDLVISAQIASHGKRVPFNDFFGWKYNYKYTCWAMYRARFFPPDSHYCSVSLFFLFFFMAPALASSKVASQNFPSENISQNLFSLPIRKYVSYSTSAWPYFTFIHENRRSLFCIWRCFSFEVNTV